MRPSSSRTSPSSVTNSPVAPAASTNAATVVDPGDERRLRQHLGPPRLPGHHGDRRDARLGRLTGAGIDEVVQGALAAPPRPAQLGARRDRALRRTRAVRCGRSRAGRRRRRPSRAARGASPRARRSPPMFTSTPVTPGTPATSSSPDTSSAAAPLPMPPRSMATPTGSRTADTSESSSTSPQPGTPAAIRSSRRHPRPDIRPVHRRVRPRRSRGRTRRPRARRARSGRSARRCHATTSTARATNENVLGDTITGAPAASLSRHSSLVGRKRDQRASRTSRASAASVGEHRHGGVVGADREHLHVGAHRPESGRRRERGFGHCAHRTDVAKSRRSGT